MKNRFIIPLAAIMMVGCAEKTITESNPVTEPEFLKDMTLVWSDEFNAGKLDTEVWSGNYYSTFDLVARTNYDEFRADKLPQPAMNFTDSTIILYTNDAQPALAYWKDSGRKISSIQTYDWNSDRNGMGQKYVGGYIEARIRRNATAESSMVNGAFWLDSPGPDLKYYVQSGDKVFDVEGVRPKGQLFEIDLCEYITTEIVLHGNVDSQGEFKGNIGHAIVPGDFVDKWVVHGMLWSPAGLKFYIDGQQVAQWWSPEEIKSPNHYMNIYLGIYAKGGQAELEADYVRMYQWRVPKNSLLPNGDFEYVNSIFPWEGDGSLTETAARNGEKGLLLKGGQKVVQYLYLDHSKEHELQLWSRGVAGLEVSVEDIELVTGKVQSTTAKEITSAEKYAQTTLKFVTGAEYGDHKKTVRVTLRNGSSEPIEVDDITLIGL